jgi:tRNA threonylcarbamoyladenosine biosynthesis protein TsaE
MRAVHESSSPVSTGLFGEILAAHLRPGDAVALSGALGAGKTCLVQGIARGLGVTERVTSPTFVLVRRHVGRIPLVHCDVYRLEHVHDLHALDDDVLASDVITCIEWADAVTAALPDERLDVTIELLGGEPGAARRLVLEARGAGWASRWDALTTALAGRPHDVPGVPAADGGPAR